MGLATTFASSWGPECSSFQRLKRRVSSSYSGIYHAQTVPTAHTSNPTRSVKHQLLCRTCCCKESHSSEAQTLLHPFSKNTPSSVSCYRQITLMKRIILASIGVLWILALPYEGLWKNTYMDEHAVQPAQVRQPGRMQLMSGENVL